jgi:hypothetical protein
VAGAMINRVDPPDRSALASEIQILVGHPFLGDPDRLLGVLMPASGVDFGNNSSVAVRWAMQEARQPGAFLMLSKSLLRFNACDFPRDFSQHFGAH